MEIPQIKAALDILQIAEELQIQIDKKTLRACCPFHQDKTPSLQFSKEKQIATCFSSNCTAGTMDVIELVKRKNNWTHAQTLNYLTREVEGSKTANNIQTATLQATITSEERILILTRLFETFERAFLSSKPAKDYAESRGLIHKNTQIGYNTGTFQHSVNLPKGKEQELLAKYEELGLIKKSATGYSVFGKMCLVFPLKNEKNQIVSFYFRSIDENNALKHFYLKNRQGLYPKYPPAETQKIIICESIIDAVSLKQSVNEDYFILANYGTEGGKEQTEAVSQLENLQEISIFFDGDQAGIKGAEKLAQQLLVTLSEVEMKIVPTPENEDINSLLTSHEPAVLEYLLNSASSFFLSAEKKKDVSEVKPPVPAKTSSFPSTISNLQIQLKGGLLRNEESLNVTLEITNNETQKKIRDRVELYEYKQVERLIKLITDKLHVAENEAEDSVFAFITELEMKRDQQKAKKQQEQEINTILSSHELQECIKFGKQANLLQKINDLIGKSGIVGEEKNRLFLFAIASSFQMSKTLHVVVQGSSGSGKTHLIKKIADLMPQERVKRFTRITEKSFYNYGEYDLKNTLIVLEDYDGMKEEAEFALRELQSNEILISSTSRKDETTGEIKSGENKVRGPIASMVATTNGELYHDNSTRVFFITIDETKEQTQQIIDFKNKLAAAEIDQEEQKKTAKFVQNFMRSLESLPVKNTWIKHIDLPVNLEQKRRLHGLFEAFCEQITLINQHQRKRDEKNRVITEKQDVELAIDLMFESIVLKVDELNGRLRDFYEKVKEFVLKEGKEYEFEQREIRQHLNLSKTHTFRNLTELLELEYIHKTYSSQRNTHHYKISYWDDVSLLRNKIKQNIENQINSI